MGLLVCTREGFEGYISSCVENAVLSRGVPLVLAEAAGEATRRNLRDTEWSTAREMGRRVRAYFNETLRRMSARSAHPDVARYRRSVIAALYAHDLRQAGVCEERIGREVDEWLASSAC